MGSNTIPKKLSPLQYERVVNLVNCALFRHFHPLSSGLLGLKAVDPDACSFTSSLRVAEENVNSLGLLPAAGYSRLIEDAVVVLGYVLSGELLMPARLEIDYLHTAGAGDTLEITARITSQKANLRVVRVEISHGETPIATSEVTAVEVRTFPVATQKKIVQAAEQGLLNPAILLEFVHLFDPEHYLAAKVALRAAPFPGLEKRVPATSEAETVTADLSESGA